MTSHYRPRRDPEDDMCINYMAGAPTRSDEKAAARKIIADLRSQLEALAAVTWCDTSDAAATLTSEIAMWERGL